jgi:hypothetical protein
LANYKFQMGLIKLTPDKLKIKKLHQVFIDTRDELIEKYDIIEWFFPVTRSGKRPLSKEEMNVIYLRDFKKKGFIHLFIKGFV